MKSHTATHRKAPAAIGEVLDMNRALPEGAQLRATKMTFYYVGKGKVACDWCKEHKRTPIRACVECKKEFCAHATVYQIGKGTLCLRCAS